MLQSLMVRHRTVKSTRRRGGERAACCMLGTALVKPAIHAARIAQDSPMSEADEKQTLHRYLQNARAVLLWKLDGLSDYDVRRPMTPTGTNLLGLVKHCAGMECQYF